MKNKYILIVFFAIINSVTIAVDLYDSNLTGDFYDNSFDNFYDNSFYGLDDDEEPVITIIGRKISNDWITINCETDSEACRQFREQFEFNFADLIPDMTDMLIDPETLTEEEKKIKKAQCYRDATKSNNACLAAVTAVGSGVGAVCVGIWETGPVALACGFLAVTGTALTAKKCNDDLADDNYICDISY